MSSSSSALHVPNPTSSINPDGAPPASPGTQSPNGPQQTTNAPPNTDNRGVPLNNVNGPQDNDCGPNQEDQEFFREMRGWLMIVAILAAGSTYQAGLNPPGSFWQNDDSAGHLAGNPILHDKFFIRYKLFFYCNALSFLSSLVIIIMLMNKRFYLEKAKVKVLEITMVLDLFAFMVAYAVGSCRKASTSIIVFLLTGAVFAYVISFALSYAMICKFASKFSCARLWTPLPSTTRHV